ncbi:MAG: AAA family ATPase [Crocinitomicaceae bacterium]|nr:AAA family ATPase [Crocinitomicaceae bacterium]
MNQPKSTFYTTVLEYFNLEPNEGQQELFVALENFARQREGKQLFILKGYAGTGKTSALGAFVQALNHYKVKTKLVAPTGRAAKVFSHKSSQDAMTIHKMIYRRKSKIDASSPISLNVNLFKNTVFIVDEASMIGDYTMQKDGSVSARNLLEDLFEFVYSGDGCKLILMGDDGQLPPVGSDTSPALSEKYLSHHYFELNISSFKLNEVVRQAQDSEILRNATRLRNTQWVDYPKFNIKEKSDLFRITGAELQDELESSYSNVGQEETIVITRSNKNANGYNQQIRGRILWYEEELCSGDSLMVVKNNYFWMGDDNRMGFIANGEIVRVKRILKREELYGFEFARVSVEFVDYVDLGEIELIIHTESLTSEGPALTRDRMKTLFYEVERDYAHLRNKKERYEAILADQYFNALQVKYAYAVTCHKSQGGQWAHVYIDQGFINDDILGPDYYRWLYTALTRGTEKVFLVNFMDEFFEEELN